MNKHSYYLLTVSEGGQKRTFATFNNPAQALAREAEPGAVLEVSQEIDRASYLEWKEANGKKQSLLPKN